MNILKYGQLAMKHLHNDVMEEAYLRMGLDNTKPIAFYGIVNERCNYKCRYCEYWRLKKYVDEMTIDEWKAALLSIKDFVGSFHIQFSGGEPFIKQGFMDLLEFCRDEGIKWGVVTNASCFTEKNIDRVLEANPFNINISIDSFESDIHNYSRGVEGSLDRIKKSIEYLVKRKNEKKMNFPLIIKPTVHSKNLHTITGTVDWAVSIGATAVNFQPVDRWTQETYDELWIEEDRFEELNEVVAELIRQKKSGAPILNSEKIIKAWPAHFREEKAPEEVGACRVGLRNYFIKTNGDVEVCWFYPPIGNVKRQSAKEIWKSEEARLRRKETVSCDKLCLFTCLSQKTIKDKVKMGMTLLKGSRN